jgi:tetratricopeptide (TPR) repeat protein
MLLLPLVLPLAAPAALAASHAGSSAEVWHQIGPNPRQYEPSPLPIPRRKRVTEVPPPAPGTTQPATQSAAAAPALQRAGPSRYDLCIAAGRQDLPAAIAAARKWLAATPTAAANAERGAASLCLAELLAQQGDYTGAQAAFAESAQQVPQADLKAPFARDAYLGSVALAGGQYEIALKFLDSALAEPPSKAPTAEENAARGAVQIDRSRALVAQNRLPEASGALEDAHRLAPNDPEGWLLSATLARRGKDLERAQRDIEVAASLAAHGDPLAGQIGLEAGVIAMLSGREDAARKSWQSVLALAPESPEAVTAKGYLDQIGPIPTSSAPAASPAPATAPPETSR